MNTKLPLRSVFLSIVFACFAFIATSQDLSTPVGYLSAINNAQEEMNQTYMAYMSAAAHGRRAKKVEKLRQKVLETIIDARNNTNGLGAYKGDNSLKKSGADYIMVCYHVFNDDYAKLINMEEIAEQSFDGMQAYILMQEKISEKLKEASLQMSEAEKTFAAKYEIKLIDGKSELSEKMEQAGKLNRYVNQMFLVFFKSNWQDGVITNAMNNKKVNEIEQGRNALLQYAKEGLTALDTLKTFVGDPSLAMACRQVLNFYKKSAESDLAKLSDYYLKQENFEKIKKSFESKPESQRTQKDVDEFNKAVKEINEAVNSFNKTINNLNSGRTQALANWENTNKEFTDRHMPHYKK
jgi:hypothetical protein